MWLTQKAPGDPWELAVELFAEDCCPARMSDQPGHLPEIAGMVVSRLMSGDETNARRLLEDGPYGYASERKVRMFLCGICGSTDQDHACPGQAPMCGMITPGGRYGEPLACAFKAGHGGNHSWATLPTFAGGYLAVSDEDLEVLTKQIANKFLQALKVIGK